MTRPGELAGRTLGGRYEVLDLVGSGGMGEVYRARDRELDDLIALKVVRHDLLAYPAVLERFRREVKLARRVTHANVARAFDFVIADGVTFYTMELVDGVSLARRLASGRRLDVGYLRTRRDALRDAVRAGGVSRHDGGDPRREATDRAPRPPRGRSAARRGRRARDRSRSGPTPTLCSRVSALPHATDEDDYRAIRAAPLHGPTPAILLPI